MAKKKVIFECMTCGYQSPRWMGKCPDCGVWDQMEEIIGGTSNPKHGVKTKGTQAEVQKLNNIEHETTPRVQTDSKEFNRVLDDGVVSKSLILIGGDSGIEKSTLLLQIYVSLSQKLGVLYIAGEESLNRTKLRADRPEEDSNNLNILAETGLEIIHQTVEQEHPDILVVDSIQTTYHSEISSAPGSVSQIQESAQSLVSIAKQMNIATFIVGHVAREGQIADPELLEHIVGAVLHFEGNEHHACRILRAVKSRFDSTSEMDIFEVKQSGLKGVQNPSEIFLEEHSTSVLGSAIVATMEGTRPLLIEVQSLVTPTTFDNPRRMTTGIDHNQLNLLMAVLEKKKNYLLQQQDAYIRVVDGVRLTEPAVGLSIIVATALNFRDKTIDGLDYCIGEVGLTGEVKWVSRIGQRIQEAARLGFKRVIIPKTNIGGWAFPEDVQVVDVTTVHDTLKYAFNNHSS